MAILALDLGVLLMSHWSSEFFGHPLPGCEPWQCWCEHTWAKIRSSTLVHLEEFNRLHISLPAVTLSVGWMTLSVGGFGVALVGGLRQLAIGGLSQKECDGFGFCFENTQT